MAMEGRRKTKTNEELCAAHMTAKIVKTKDSQISLGMMTLPTEGVLLCVVMCDGIDSGCLLALAGTSQRASGCPQSVSTYDLSRALLLKVDPSSLALGWG